MLNIKKDLLSIKKDLLTKQKGLLTQKKKFAYIHKTNPRQIATANSLGKQLRQIAAANYHGK